MTTMRSTRRILAGLAAVLASLSIGVPVLAQDPPLFVVDESITVTAGDAAVARLTITNLASDALVVRLESPRAACASTTPVLIDRGTASTIDLRLAGDCLGDADERRATVVGSVPGSDDVVEITLARSTPPAGPDYADLFGFLYAFVIAATIILIINARGGVSVADPLPAIADSWSFADSWASNIGVAAALFTGVFGTTDILEQIVGGDSTGQVAVAAVAAALAASLIGVGPILLAVLRTRDDRRHTAGGILAASGVVLTANLGLVITLWAIVGERSTLNSAFVTICALTACVLLVWYTARTVPETIRLGARPAPTEPSETMLASELIAEAVLRAGGVSLGTPTPDATGGDEAGRWIPPSERFRSRATTARISAMP